MKMKKTLMMLWMAVSLMVSLVGCSSEEMDYENPDVTVFVKQLKAQNRKFLQDARDEGHDN